MPAVLPADRRRKLLSRNEPEGAGGIEELDRRVAKGAHVEPELPGDFFAPFYFLNRSE